MINTWVLYNGSPIELAYVDRECYYNVNDLNCAGIWTDNDSKKDKFYKTFKQGDIVNYCRELKADGELFVSSWNMYRVCTFLDHDILDNFSFPRFVDGVSLVSYESTKENNFKKLKNTLLFSKRCMD